MSYSPLDKFPASLPGAIGLLKLTKSPSALQKIQNIHQHKSLFFSFVLVWLVCYRFPEDVSGSKKFKVRGKFERFSFTAGSKWRGGCRRSRGGSLLQFSTGQTHYFSYILLSTASASMHWSMWVGHIPKSQLRAWKGALGGSIFYDTERSSFVGVCL